MAKMLGHYTRKEWDLLPEGFPAQLIEGDLVREPSPTFGHQRVALLVAERIRTLVGSRRMAIAPLDVPIDEFNVFQPDVVVFREPIEDDQTPDERPLPLLAVEILSPGTDRRDRTVKRIRMLDAGVAEVWLVDPARKLIERHDRGRYRDVPKRATGDDALHSEALAGFSLSPAEVWPPHSRRAGPNA